MNFLLSYEVQVPISSFANVNPVVPHAYERTIIGQYDEVSSIWGCPYARIGRTTGVIHLYNSAIQYNAQITLVVQHSQLSYGKSLEN